MSCLRAIAAGTTRLNGIAQRIGRTRSEEARPLLDKFVSEDAFERVCQEWTLRSIDAAAEAGRWWGSVRRREDGKLRSRPHEADVVAIDSQGAVLALGSCKWPAATTTGHAHGAEELAKLETIRAELEAPDADLYFFDRLAFSPRMHELADEREDVHLVLAGQLGKQLRIKAIGAISPEAGGPRGCP
jgi:hypothetical protein